MDTHKGEIMTTTVNVGELYEGALTSRSRDVERSAVDGLLETMSVVPFGPKHARVYGTLARARKLRGLPGGPLDLLIASIAVAEGVSVATRNTKDFEGNDGLLVEKW